MVEEDAGKKDAVEGVEAVAEAEEAGGKQESAAGNDLFDASDDLMDLFTEEDEVNEELAAMTAGLDEVDMGDLLAQVRDIRRILDRR